VHLVRGGGHGDAVDGDGHDGGDGSVEGGLARGGAAAAGAASVAPLPAGGDVRAAAPRVGLDAEGLVEGLGWYGVAGQDGELAQAVPAAGGGPHVVGGEGRGAGPDGGGVGVPARAAAARVDGPSTWRHAVTVHPRRRGFGALAASSSCETRNRPPQASPILSGVSHLRRRPRYRHRPAKAGRRWPVAASGGGLGASRHSRPPSTRRPWARQGAARPGPDPGRPGPWTRTALRHAPSTDHAPHAQPLPHGTHASGYAPQVSGSHASWGSGLGRPRLDQRAPARTTERVAPGIASASAAHAARTGQCVWHTCASRRA
jgi:hypothetical protein